MPSTTVRFTPEQHAALKQEAEAMGVSAAEFIREAVLLRLADRHNDSLSGAEDRILAAIARLGKPT